MKTFIIFILLVISNLLSIEVIRARRAEHVATIEADKTWSLYNVCLDAEVTRK